MPPSIVLLHDAAAAAGRPDESDTLLEAQAIAAALERLGYATTTLAVGLDLGALERALRELSPHAVFNLVESLEGRGRLVHVVPALLASLGVPFTGCSAEALAATSHKPAAKRLLRQDEIVTPATLGPAAVDSTRAGDGTMAGDGTWIVKSVFEHSSLGIDDSSVVAGAEAARRVLAARRAELGGEWFAERFVPGRELNVGIVAAPEG